MNTQPKSCARYGTGIPGEHRSSQLETRPSWEQNEEVVLGYCPTRDIVENERTATDV